ncbi:MAG: trypsin-like serine protease [Candidatus Taylorbacteria bacterium]|nr:trypsin-like serine protease [Candidatus Taylorbacteria bacterium]
MLFLARLLIHALGGIALLWAVATPTPSHEVPAVPVADVAEKPLASSTALARVQEPKVASTTLAVEKEPVKIPPKKVPLVPTAKTVPLPTSPATTTPVVTPVTPEPVVPQLSFDELNTKTREALVNILCTTRRGGSFNPISGSGSLIDPRGVILTNAHIGQYFLLKDYLTPDFLDCVIRTGEPAQNRYRAKLLYLSPFWISANAKKIDIADATGTGEHDFALLLIQSSTNVDAPLPETFPYIPMDYSNRAIRAKEEALAAGYPAGFLSGINIQKDLYPSSSIVQPGTIYSFEGGTSDMFSIGGSVVAQQGSSGGAIVSREGKLIGLIVTSSMGDTTGERDLNALTMSHIGDSFKKHTKESIDTLFEGDVQVSMESFNENVAPALKKALEDALLPN